MNEFDDFLMQASGERGKIEFDLVMQILPDPDAGIRICERMGVTIDHFSERDDSRMIFTACKLFRDKPAPTVYRVVRQFLEVENFQLSQNLYKLVQQSHIENLLFRYFFIIRKCIDLIRIERNIRDAHEHFNHACRILKMGSL